MIEQKNDIELSVLETDEKYENEIEIENENKSNIASVIELEDIEPLENWQYGIIYGFVLSFIIGIIIYTIVSDLDDYYFLADIGLKVVILLTLYFLNGYFLVKKLHIELLWMIEEQEQIKE